MKRDKKKRIEWGNVWESTGHILRKFREKSKKSPENCQESIGKVPGKYPHITKQIMGKYHERPAKY